MTGSLKEGISEVIESTRAEQRVLDIAGAAATLAEAFGADPGEVASRITEGGSATRINMKMGRPREQERNLAAHPA